MMGTNPIIVLASLIAGAAITFPVHAHCGARLFSSGVSYVVTPGCEQGGCGSSNTSVTDDVTGAFWVIGEGDPTVLSGLDNGSFPLVDGWGYVFPGYPMSFSSSWIADIGIDSCPDFSAGPHRCMAILIMDNDADTGAGAFALATQAPDGIGNYDFQRNGNIALVALPELHITNSVRIAGGGNGVVVTVDGLSVDDIAAGLYLDPGCPGGPGDGGVAELIVGYQVFMRQGPPNEVPPNDTHVDDWIPVGPLTPLGAPATVTSSCDGLSNVAVYLTAGLVFDSNYRSVWISRPATRVECGTNLADPDDLNDVERKPRNRERRSRGSRGR